MFPFIWFADPGLIGWLGPAQSPASAQPGFYGMADPILGCAHSTENNSQG